MNLSKFSDHLVEYYRKEFGLSVVNTDDYIIIDTKTNKLVYQVSDNILETMLEYINKLDNYIDEFGLDDYLNEFDKEIIIDRDI